jgi:hypothetical protein
MFIDKGFQPHWPFVYRQDNWFPIDLAYDPVAGLLVLDSSGKVFKVTIDEWSIHLKFLFQLQGPYTPSTIAANNHSVLVSSNNMGRCFVSEYSLASGKASKPQPVGFGSGPCNGIAADGQAIYLVLPIKHEIWYRPQSGASIYHS